MFEQKCYIAKHKNFETRMASRSGGIFTAVSDVVLACGGSVYGVAMRDSCHAELRKAVTPEQRNEFRGSKYIQSEAAWCYRQVQEDLRQGKEVLFSGTPCQAAALKKYLSAQKVPTEHLLVIDIVCHGVPSQRVWEEELMSVTEKENVIHVDFRDKTNYGWDSHRTTISLVDKDIVTDRFTQLFYSHFILRKACFHCPYKTINRMGDITIGDAWGVQKHNQAFNDNKGVSLVLINSEKADRLFLKLDSIEYISVPVENYCQTPLVENYPVPNGRKLFWRNYFTFGYRMVSKLYSGRSTSLAIKVARKLLTTAKLYNRQ